MEKLDQLKDFDALRITLASPEEIVSWSHGEVVKPETINYRTFKAEKDGLFDERIFGPTKDFECYCGKYKRVRFKGVICDKCGVEVTYSRVRRERMGHISLSTPCAHVWFFRGIPSQMGILLDVSPRDLESVIYFAAYLVTGLRPERRVLAFTQLEKDLEKESKQLQEDFQTAVAAANETSGSVDPALVHSDKNEVKDSNRFVKEKSGLEVKRAAARLREGLSKAEDALARKYDERRESLKRLNYLSVIPEVEYAEIADYVDMFAEVKMGAEALLIVLAKVDLEEITKNLRRKINRAGGARILKLTKRLKVVEGFRQSGVKPDWMILRNVAVIPPDLRPMVQLEGGRFATSDHNDLYRRVINRNNRLRRLLEMGAPEIIIRNEKRMLQEAVDALFDSVKQHSRNQPMRGKQKLRSLSDLLKGKQGRFRRNLLGKRVDYSGRSVIVVGPHLKLDECGLPKEMALELFKPFVLREIMIGGLAPNLKSARYVLESRSDQVWDMLEKVVENHPVLLNRAPTLHRLGIQAFYPKLIDGYAIRLHPCVCSGFNADFDGDQMAVHVPLSTNACEEGRELMLASHNLLLPSTGSPVTLPSREMLVGIYYLTMMVDSDLPEKIFSDEEEAFLAYSVKKVALRIPVKVRLGDGKIIETTIGRLLFNRILPASLRYFNDEITKENRAIKILIEKSLRQEGREKTSEFIDNLKDLGFHFSTDSGMSMAISDGKISPLKPEIMAKSEAKVLEIDRNFRRGLITKREKTRLSEQVWTETTSLIDKLTWENLGRENPIQMMVKSGARGSRDQVKQIAGMRGLIVDPLGHLIELPIKSNYVEGLSVFEYFSGARGARKGLVDTALKTADAGYLTRRLVDVAQEVIIRQTDCGTVESLEIVRGEESILSSFTERILGRVLAAPVKSPKGKKPLYEKGTLIDEETAAAIDAAGTPSVRVRSPLTCSSSYGVCANCYGMDLSTRKLVDTGLPVGVIAAQSIGEPGTQLTLRTYHTGGILGKDITQGLPRVEEVFEARTPKFMAVLADVSGQVTIREEGEQKRIIITPAKSRIETETKDYLIDSSLEIKVNDGDKVAVGAVLTTGYLDLNQYMRLCGVTATQKYIVGEIQKVYSSQGVSLNDKHVETIARQMFSRVRVDYAGETKFLPGEIVSRYLFCEENDRVLKQNKKPATARVILLGITKASLETDSFLAAASFQETTRVLTEASISGRVDKLLGLKENVIIGRLIPTGVRAVMEGRKSII